MENISIKITAEMYANIFSNIATQISSGVEDDWYGISPNVDLHVYLGENAEVFASLFPVINNKTVIEKELVVVNFAPNRTETAQKPGVLPANFNAETVQNRLCAKNANNSQIASLSRTGEGEK